MDTEIQAQMQTSTFASVQEAIAGAYAATQALLEDAAKQSDPIRTPLVRTPQLITPGGESVEPGELTTGDMSDDEADETLQQVEVTFPIRLPAVVCSDKQDGEPPVIGKTEIPSDAYFGDENFREQHDHDGSLICVGFPIRVNFRAPEFIFLKKMVLLVELSTPGSLRPMAYRMTPVSVVEKQAITKFTAAADLGKVIPGNIVELKCSAEKDAERVVLKIEAWGLGQQSVGWRVSGAENVYNFTIQPELIVEFDGTAPLTVNTIVKIQAGKQGLFAQTQGIFAHPMWYGYHPGDKHLYSYDFLNNPDEAAIEKRVELVVRKVKGDLDPEYAKAEAESIAALLMKSAREKSDQGARRTAEAVGLESRVTDGAWKSLGSPETVFDLLQVGGSPAVSLTSSIDEYRIGRLLEKEVSYDSAEPYYLAAAEAGEGKALKHIDHGWKRLLYRVKSWVSRRGT